MDGQREKKRWVRREGGLGSKENEKKHGNADNERRQWRVDRYHGTLLREVSFAASFPYPFLISSASSSGSIGFPRPSRSTRLFSVLSPLTRMDARRTALNIIQGTASGNTPLNFIAVWVEDSAEPGSTVPSADEGDWDSQSRDCSLVLRNNREMDSFERTGVVEIGEFRSVTNIFSRKIGDSSGCFEAWPQSMSDEGWWIWFEVRKWRDKREWDKIKVIYWLGK